MIIDSPIISGSLILTGSAAFTGSLTLSGSMTTVGTITATTLVVQTITSSISSITGSTSFGSSSINNHNFTGSLIVSGGMSVNSTAVNIGNDISNPTLILRTGGSTTYSGNITTNSNVDSITINGGAGAHYDSGSGISFMGADRYGTKTAGVLTLYAGNAVNNTGFGCITMNTANTERVRINYGGQLLINTTSAGYNNPMLFISASSGVCVPLQTVADASGRLIRFYNSDFNNSNAGTDVRMGFGAGSGATYFNMQVYTAGETAAGSLVLQPSYGNVSIGTASDNGQRLQVNGTLNLYNYTSLTTQTKTTTSGANLSFGMSSDYGLNVGGDNVGGLVVININEASTNVNLGNAAYVGVVVNPRGAAGSITQISKVQGGGVTGLSVTMSGNSIVVNATISGGGNYRASLTFIGGGGVS